MPDVSPQITNDGFKSYFSILEAGNKCECEFTPLSEGIYITIISPNPGHKAC